MGAMGARRAASRAGASLSELLVRNCIKYEGLVSGFWINFFEIVKFLSGLKPNENQILLSSSDLQTLQVQVNLCLLWSLERILTFQAKSGFIAGKLVP